ncbi:MAG TPA: carboxypeptidase-like regulatory domain-containing protein [Vicinamibacterales bacterium]|nr:carboxypeptidase-like regulatory domain-containing protein [Vicinamibacterales bacterium]
MLALFAALLIAQSTPQSIPADTPGRVTGRVLIRGENVPVADARVTLMLMRREPPKPGTIPGPPPQAVTSADGRFTFDRIAPGEYRLSADKSGFAVGPGVLQQSASVTVAAGQSVPAPDLFLDRGGAIAGRILDANGDAIVEAQVMALRRFPISPAMAARGNVPPSRPLLPAGRPAQTNDLGEFRLFGLAPGEYFVASSGRMQSPMQTTGSPAPKTTLSTTYFPGVTDEGAAQAVSVAAGQTTNGIEIRMTPQPAFQVSGVVVGDDGNPIEGAMVNLSPSGQPGPLGPHTMSRTDASGRFRVGGVPAGTYRVYATQPMSGGVVGGLVGGVTGGVSTSTTSISSGGVVTSSTMNGSSRSEVVTVTVADGNVGGIRIVVTRH